jgi:Nucleotide modification associated domain 2
MARHYSYRADHDLGFAPHIWRCVATVCGCKVSTIERWAEVGSWIVGIGGNGTGKPNQLLYAMQVTATPKYCEFREQHQANAAYLSSHPIEDEAHVLVSHGKFYYFGDQAVSLPTKLSNIIHPTQGCKRLSDEDVTHLIRFLGNLKPGKHGEPNNAPHKPIC